MEVNRYGWCLLAVVALGFLVCGVYVGALDETRTLIARAKENPYKYDPVLCGEKLIEYNVAHRSSLRIAESLPTYEWAAKPLTRTFEVQEDGRRRFVRCRFVTVFEGA